MMYAKELRAIVNETKNNREAKECQEREAWFSETTDSFKSLANDERTEATVNVPSNLTFTKVIELFQSKGFQVSKLNSYREIAVRW